MSTLQITGHLENSPLSTRRCAFDDTHKEQKILKNFASFFFHQSRVDLGVHHQRVSYFKTIKGSTPRRSLCGCQKMMSHVTASVRRSLSTLESFVLRDIVPSLKRPVSKNSHANPHPRSSLIF